MILKSKTPTETRFEVFDFVSNLAVGETITSQTVTAEVYSGVDSSPQSIVNGSATVVNSTQVQQSMTGGILGVIYDLVCSVTTSLGQTLNISAYYAIAPNVP